MCSGGNETEEFKMEGILAFNISVAAIQNFVLNKAH
jgi:hypothetical protein